MAIPKWKQRLTITIHNETKDMMNELLSLHDNLTYSNLIEIALYCYANLVTAKLENNEEKEINENAKS